VKFTFLSSHQRLSIIFIFTSMAHDITEEFRTIVHQQRKEHGDSRRTKLRRSSHLIPGEARVDGAPPFMQAYMKEGYTIVSHHPRLLTQSLTFEKLQHITSLTRMLAAVRRAYLDVHARPPPAARQTVRMLDATGVDAWADIKFFTNAERDQIDIQARTILTRCADHVRDMESLEKREIGSHILLPTPA
jgi:syntaxin 18